MSYLFALREKYACRSFYNLYGKLKKREDTTMLQVFVDHKKSSYVEWEIESMNKVRDFLHPHERSLQVCIFSTDFSAINA